MSSSDHTVTLSGFTIEPVVVPVSIDAADAADFIAMAAVRSAVEAELRGSAGEVMTAAELLPDWKDESKPMAGLVAKVDGRVVARGNLALPLGADECWGAISVLPEFRGRGIGSALYGRLEQLARDAGRTTIQNQTTCPAGVESETVPAPTGFGSVPIDLPSTRFLRRHGFSLEQVGRISELPLPLDADLFGTRLAEAAGAAAGYRTVTWQGRTPEEWVEAIALLRTRMSIDAPNAGIQLTDVWTADRVRAVDDLWADSPRVALTSIVVEEATGRAAGFTELEPISANWPYGSPSASAWRRSMPRRTAPCSTSTTGSASQRPVSPRAGARTSLRSLRTDNGSTVPGDTSGRSGLVRRRHRRRGTRFWAT